MIDHTANTIEYYDSIGAKPIPELNKLLNKMKKMYPDYKYLQNHIRHQNKNSECGVYSIYFLVQRLLGYSFERIIQNAIDDDNMIQYRQLIFTD